MTGLAPCIGSKEDREEGFLVMASPGRTIETPWAKFGDE
jgi:hypothetical protein